MLNLVSRNNPILSQTAYTVDEGMDLTELVRGMFDTAKRLNGAGLAANQVGRLERVIVINLPNIQQEIINPVITKLSRIPIKSKEGCLSYPELFVFKRRASRVTLEGFDLNWKPVTLKLKGLAAIVAQHEVDHLNGITIGRADK